MLSHGVYVLTSRSEDRYGAATVTWVSQASFKPPLVMAAVILAMLPPVAVVLLMQRWFIKGLVETEK